MSSISSIGSSIISSLYSSAAKSAKTASSVENLFDKLDSTGKGYLEKSDLANAFAQISGTTSSTSTSTSTSSASVDDVFSKLDSDSNGKVTESELSSGLENLAAALDSQFNQMRMGGGKPPPPPPPAQNDSGLTKDQLASQISEIGSSDSKRSELMTKIVNNFDAADTDSDGKVSFQEAMAYDQSTKAASTTSNSETMASATSATASSTATESTSDLAIMKRIMELMNAYALTSSSDSSSLASTLSVSA